MKLKTQTKIILRLKKAWSCNRVEAIECRVGNDKFSVSLEKNSLKKDKEN
jgi:hypothetical protein